MKTSITTLLLCSSIVANATVKDSTIVYDLPDSVKATVFIADIKVIDVTAKQFSVGISATGGTLRFSERKGYRSISFYSYDRFSRPVATGNGVRVDRNIKGTFFSLTYNWQLNKSYKLMIAIASDSAANFNLRSAYVFLPEENKWKFLGTIRNHGNTTLKGPQVNFHTSKKGTAQLITGDVWCQRINGSWKNMKSETLPNPTINWFGHVDSVQQRQKDIRQIEDSIAAGKTDAIKNEQGVYYTIMKEGTGRQVSVNDTVVAHYKGYLFSDGMVFDQTKENTATFPLRRLIRGWQIGVPLLKVGGKIKLVIPSDMAYSIRTRAAKIPPNSILVFEIEVVDVKSPL
jgi:FKBP-type peptidyl-prolyl cis-trans isomerase FkpA